MPRANANPGPALENCGTQIVFQSRLLNWWALLILIEFGGPKESRTPDLRIANAALYQLSYGPAKFYYNILLLGFKPQFHCKKSADCDPGCVCDDCRNAPLGIQI